MQIIAYNMPQKRDYNYLREKLLEMQSKGIYAFSLERIRSFFPGSSDQALALALNRLVKKGNIVSVHHGFYVIVPPEYAQQGILPIPLFIDSLMSHLKKRYYVGLINAAALHGAAHQQPQAYFVMTEMPALRMKITNGLKIHYLTKKKFPSVGIEQRKTDAGYFFISTPELTAFDLVQYENRIGGLNRVAQIIAELAEAIDVKKLQMLLKRNEIPYAYIQRLGFILQVKLKEHSISEILLDYLDQSKKRFHNVPLKSKGKRSGFPIDSRWRIIENVTIDFGQ